MTGGKTAWAVAVVVLLAAGAVAPVLMRRNSGVAAETRDPRARPVVDVALATEQPLVRTLRVSGTLRSGSEATLSAKQGGKISAVRV